MRRAAALALALSLACCARKEEIRLTSSSIATESRPDRTVHSKYTFELTMPTHGARYQLRDFVIVDSGGHSHMPTQLQVSHGSGHPDVATPTFEFDAPTVPVELRVGEFRHQLHIR